MPLDLVGPGGGRVSPVGALDALDLVQLMRLDVGGLVGPLDSVGALVGPISSIGSLV